jgi:hypothetical protein
MCYGALGLVLVRCCCRISYLSAMIQIFLFDCCAMKGLCKGLPDAISYGMKVIAPHLKYLFDTSVEV